MQCSETPKTTNRSVLERQLLQPRLQSNRDGVLEVKALLRKAAERTVEGLWAAIGRLIDVFMPDECANYFAAAGYDAD